MRKLISEALIVPRPMELGKIKIGGRGQKMQSNGKEWYKPVRFSHFVVTTRRRGEDGNFTLDRHVHDSVGEAPTELDVRLMFDTVAENFQSSMLIYKGRKRMFECDGEVGRNCETGVQAPCLRAGGKECKCKPFGRLSVILEAAPTYGGFYLFRTTSWESIANLQTILTLFEEQFGSLRGLPLRMVVYPTTSEEHGEQHKVGIVLRVPYETARKAALEYHSSDQLERRQLKLLAAGVAESIAEGEELEGEEIEAEFVLDPEHAEELKKEEEVGPARDATQERVAELQRQLQEKLDAKKAKAGVGVSDENQAGVGVSDENPPGIGKVLEDAPKGVATFPTAQENAGVGDPLDRPDPEPDEDEEVRLSRRYFALFRERFPHPDDKERRHQWQEYVTGWRSSKDWGVKQLTRAIEALEQGRGFDLWPEAPAEPVAEAGAPQGDLPF